MYSRILTGGLDMNKTINLFLIAIILVAVLVSCSTTDYTVFTEDLEGWAPVSTALEAKKEQNKPTTSVAEETSRSSDVSSSEIHVKDFASFKTAFATAKEKGIKNIVFDSDITWDSSETELALEATGLTIDLNNHTIKNIPKNALNFTGSGFTVKNGTFTASGDNNRYSLSLNYNGSNATTEELKALAESKIPGAYNDSDPVWSNRIVLENIKATACLIGYSTAEIKNCEFTGGAYRALVMQGSSGVIENVKAVTSDAGSSAGLVAHSYGVVTLKGNVTAKGKFGFYAARSGKILVSEGATVSASGFQTYGVYIETGGEATFGAGVSLGTANGFQAYMKEGILTLNKGVVLTDDSGKVTDKLSVDGEGGTVRDNR